MISQEELEKYDAYKVKIKEKTKKLKLAEAAIKDLEVSLVKRLESREKVEKGKYRPSVKTTESRASIAWKGVVVELKGLAYVERMIQLAERHLVKRLEIIIGIQK